MWAAAPIHEQEGLSQSGFQENVTKFSRALNTLVNRSFSRKLLLKRSHLLAAEKISKTSKSK